MEDVSLEYEYVHVFELLQDFHSVYFFVEGDMMT